MYVSRTSSQPPKYMEGDQPCRPIELPCRYHSGSICLNYCHQISCFKLLCQECIEQHLDHHKKNGLPILSIKSFKKVRQFCVDKLNKLIQDLIGRMSTLKQPKNPQQILQQANMKFQAIKKLMLQIIQQQLARFSQQLRNKVNQSFSAIKNLEEVHQNLTKIIMQLKQSKAIIIQGSKQIPQTVQKILAMNQNLYVDTFSRQASLYAQNLSSVDFDISINQNKFRSSVNDCLKITKNQFDNVSNNSADFGKYSKVSQVRNYGTKQSSMTTPINKNKGKGQFSFQGKDAVNLTMEADLKLLHFFESSSSFLHLLEVNSTNSIKREKIHLNGYEVPSFHASILIPQGYIFISGGIIQLADNEIKSQRLSRFSLKAKGNQSFKRDFAKLRPRSSHSICENGDYIYILGGYGPESTSQSSQIQKTVERVNIRNGQVEYETKSRYGGANISVVINGSILKASQQGVQMYNINSKKWSTITTSQNYTFIRGCGWSRISRQSILIYGGYEQNQQGIDICMQWKLTQNELISKNLPYRLPYKQGFLNNPGIIVDGYLYALQNICIQEEQQQSQMGVVEGERSILRFDGTSWKQIKM